MHENLKISVVTRTHNALLLTDIFLGELEKFKDSIHQIVVVNDGSVDEQITPLLKKWGNLADFLDTGKYLEYCKSLNKGVDYAIRHGTDVVLIINNDTKGFSENFFEEARHKFSQDKNLAFLGPKVLDYDGNVLSDGTPKEKFGVIMDVPTEGYFIRVSVIQKIGLFNEKLVRYFEDLDLIIRLRNEGYLVRSSSDIYFYHLCNGSSSKQAWVPNYYRARNVHWFIRHYCDDKSFYWRLRKSLNSIPFSLRRIQIFIRRRQYLKVPVVLSAYLCGTFVGIFTKW
jgi:GT2 family glycosyltransferase